MSRLCTRADRQEQEGHAAVTCVDDSTSMRGCVSIPTSSTCMSAGRSKNCGASVAKMEFVFNEDHLKHGGSFSGMIPLLAAACKIQQSPTKRYIDAILLMKPLPLE